MVSPLQRDLTTKMGLQDRRSLLYSEVSELRSDLESIKDAHRLVQKEIKGIRSAMKLLIKNYKHMKPDERRGSNTTQMMTIPNDYTTDVDLETLCCDLPILEPFPDDDIFLFGECDDYDSTLPDEQNKFKYLPRRQSYQFGSPSPDHMSFDARRTSPTRASIHCGSDLGLSLLGFARNGSPGRLTAMQENECEEEYDTKTDTEITEITKAERDDSALHRKQTAHEYHHDTRMHVQVEREQHTKRRTTSDPESAHHHFSGDFVPHDLGSITEGQEIRARRPPPQPRRGSMHPTLHMSAQSDTFPEFRRNTPNGDSAHHASSFDHRAHLHAQLAQQMTRRGSASASFSRNGPLSPPSSRRGPMSPTSPRGGPLSPPSLRRGSQLHNAHGGAISSKTNTASHMTNRTHLRRGSDFF